MTGRISSFVGLLASLAVVVGAALLSSSAHAGPNPTYNTVIATVPLGTGPAGIAVTPDGTEAWVALNGGSGGGGHDVQTIDTATNIAGPAIATTGVGPTGIAITPDGTRVYVSNSRSGNLTAIQRAGHLVLEVIDLLVPHPNVTFVAINPAGTKAYVAATGNVSGTQVAVVTIPGHAVSHITVGTQPFGLAFNPAGNRLYVTSFQDHAVSIIDPVTDTVIGTIPGLGTGSTGIAVTPNGLRAYVVNAVSATVSVVDLVTNMVIGSIPVAANYGLAITPDGTRAYAAMAGANAVAVIDLASNTVVTTIPTGAGSAGSNIAINPAGTRAYVANESGNTASVIDIRPFVNDPPTASAGPDRTVAAGADCTGSVQLDGSASSDPNGDTLTFTWTGPFGTATGMRPTVTLPRGVNTINLTVDDGHGGTSSDTVVITVVDATPPAILALSVAPGLLWPPNHQMVAVSLTVSAADDCGNAVCRLVGVSSNEPENGLGDGDTAPDGEITGPLTVNLRAERSGKGTGRQYTLTVQCTDEAGNSSQRTITVTVPKSQGK